MDRAQQWIAIGGALGVVALAVVTARRPKAPSAATPQSLSVTGTPIAEPPVFAPIALPSVVASGPKATAGSYEIMLSVPPSSNPFSDAECAAPIEERLAIECGLEGKAIVKLAIVSGRTVGVTLITMKDRPSATACMRTRLFALHWRSTPGLSSCILTLETPVEEITVARPGLPFGSVEPIPTAPGVHFDKKAAKASLAGIPYKDCGTGGWGKVTVTFAPSGSVTSAVVTTGDFDGATRSCIQNRFKGAKVPAFDGAPVPVGWTLSL